MKVCSSCLSTTHAKSAMGPELEMETQSDTRHNLEDHAHAHTNRLFALRELPPPCHLFITKKKKKNCLKADM